VRCSRIKPEDTAPISDFEREKGIPNGILAQIICLERAKAKCNAVS